MKTTEPEAKINSSIKLDITKEIKLPTAVLGLEALPDGSRLYAACLDGGVYEVDAATGQAQLIGRHDSYASGVALLGSSGTLVSAGYDGMLRWHDLGTRQTFRQVQAHRFWSWKMAVSDDESLIASGTGQYLAGGYKYEPAPEQEPSVKVFDAVTGKVAHQFSHVPPVLSVAFAPGGQFLAAANMMGEVRIWDMASGKLISTWSTPDFTSWGIIKSHHYIGGIFALHFTPDGEELLAAGMGPMTDPMAGNGKQTWQRFVWRGEPARKTGEIIDSERGNGLMETLSFHPGGDVFLMAGRLAQGKWNLGFFDAATGKLAHSLDAKMRVTSAKFTGNGERLILGGAVGQERKKDGKYPEFGRLKVYQCAV